MLSFRRLEVGDSDSFNIFLDRVPEINFLARNVYLGNIRRIHPNAQIQVHPLLFLREEIETLYLPAKESAALYGLYRANDELVAAATVRRSRTNPAATISHLFMNSSDLPGVMGQLLREIFLAQEEQGITEFRIALPSAVNPRALLRELLGNRYVLLTEADLEAYARPVYSSQFRQLGSCTWPVPVQLMRVLLAEEFRSNALERQRAQAGESLARWSGGSGN